MTSRRASKTDGGLKAFVVASLVLHALVLTAGRFKGQREASITPVYNVRLVTSEPGGGVRAKAPAPLGTPEAKAAPVAAPEPVAKTPPPAKAAPKVAAATKPAPKAAKPTAVKSTATKPVAAMKSAAPVKEAAAETNLADALRDVKKMVKGRGAADGAGKSAEWTPTEFGSGEGGRQVGALAIQIYAGQVQTAIQSKWNVPGDMARLKIEVHLGLKVAADGTVQEVWIDKSSGVGMFDESALRAVKAASPLPPPPATSDGVFKFFSRFTPQGALRSE